MNNKMNNIISEEVSTYIIKRNNEVRLCEHIRCTLLHNANLDEGDSNKTNEVLNLIKNNQYENSNANRFYDSLKQSKHSLMLTDYTPAELSKMKLFKLNGYNIGFALKLHGNEYSEIVAVHNNESDVNGIGNQLIQSAIDNGGCFLDHFDVPFLSNLYQNLGFIEYDRESYNPEYDSDSEFKNKYGQSDIIYRVHKNCKSKLN